MTEVVVDASVAVKWLIPEVHSEAATSWLNPAIQLSAPDFVLLEIASTLWKKVRRGELAEEVAPRILAALETAPLELQPSAPYAASAVALATSVGRTVYDCLYLAIAVGRGCRVVTADRKFYAAVTASPLAARILWVEDSLGEL